ncbi:MAG TPA: methyltransferase domain-containing protein [Gemmatimonadaceae bacterium]|nr:methyltransferase domain-containing protein [Gemmatimonadaceae bacterium]
MLELLEHNTGFEDPALWADYAGSHGFQRVAAVKIVRCPDCSAEPGRSYGQYVYYSTLIRLRECTRCGLIWSDAHIDSRVRRAHFETAYKGDVYFRERRLAIFQHLSRVIADLAPEGARVLDVGGARGDLMRAVAVRRPDLDVTVHDISRTATAWAAAHFGFATLCGDAQTLSTHTKGYDIAVLSDVLYYEPNLPVLWSALSRLIHPKGAVVIRVPNLFQLVRLGAIWHQLVDSREQRRLQDRVPYYNPEHIFIFRQRYLRRRLQGLGFTRIQAIPSPMLSNTIPDAVRSTYFRLALFANRLSRSTLVLTPSMLVVARRRSPEAALQA